MTVRANELSESSRLRVPPQSIEAESSVLGALLLDNKALDLIGDTLAARDFYRTSHQLIFGAINTLIQRSSPADVITVNDYLLSQGHAEESGGLSYLNALAQYVPSATNIQRYAEIVREKSILRRLISASDETIVSAFSQEGRAVQGLLEDAETRILSIGENGIKQAEVKSLDEQIMRAIDWLQHRADNPDERAGVLSGFFDLDDLTGGFQDGDLIVMAGRPSMGKTSLAMNVAEHAAIEQNLPVLVISLEMQADQLTRRTIGSVAKVNQEHIKSGNLSDEEWGRVTDAMEKMRGHVLDVLDDGGCTIASIRAVARRVARKHKKLGLIVVDYLQLLEGRAESSDGRSVENRATEVGNISRGLKLLAKELQCPVIALSQLNRGVENRPDKRPVMSDLRDSGAIEQDADTILFIYRDEYYTKDACKEPGVAEIIIGKQRNGPTGVVKLAWQSRYTRFENLSH